MRNPRKPTLVKIHQERIDRQHMTEKLYEMAHAAVLMVPLFGFLIIDALMGLS